MEDFVYKLKQDVQCSLCNDTLTEPKILKCFHIFCKPCIKRHAELIKQVNVFKCPKCKSETRLPELNSVDDLKPSLLHSRMVKMLEFVESEKVCSVSGSHPQASWHCFDCNRSLCDECEKSHSLFTKDHKAFLLNSLKKEDVVLMLRENYCQDHEAKYDFYCKDCDECLCLECFKNQKCGIHNTVHIQDFIFSKRSCLQEASDLIKAKKEEMDKQLQTLKEITKTAKGSGEQAKTEVQKTVKRLTSWLEENEKELMKEIEKKIEKAEQNQSQGQAAVDQTQSVLEYMSKVMENGDLSEIDATLKDIEGYNNYKEKPNRQESCFEFACSKEVNTIRNLGIGILKPMLTDPAMSLIQLKSKDLEAQKKSALVVLTKTSSGNLNADPDDVVDVEITSEDGVKIETKTIRNDGKIEVEFMAKVAGQLTANVQVNGKHVSNSPLVMNVQPQQQITITTVSDFQMKGINTTSSDFTGIAINKDNSRIAIADQSAHCIHVFNLSGDLLLTYGSQGNGLDRLNNPRGLAFLNETDLVIADFGNDRICIINTDTGKLIRCFGKRGTAIGDFKYPRGVHVGDDGNIIVSDYHNHRFQVFSKDRKHLPVVWTKQGSFDPVSTVTHNGRFYVLDDNACSIHVFEKKDGKLDTISSIGTRGNADGQLNKPRGLAIDNDHHLLVCDGGNDRIQKFTLDGRFLSKKDISNPCNIAVLKDGKFLVTAGKKVVLFSKQISRFLRRC